MSIEVTNDGKEKHQSFEAKADGCTSQGDWNFRWSAEGYGFDKYHALRWLFSAMDDMKIEIMAKTQAELAIEMGEVTEQLKKVGNESAKSVAKIAELEEVIKNLPNRIPLLK